MLRDFYQGYFRNIFRRWSYTTSYRYFILKTQFRIQKFCLNDPLMYKVLSSRIKANKLILTQSGRLDNQQLIEFIGVSLFEIIIPLQSSPVSSPVQTKRRLLLISGVRTENSFPLATIASITISG